MPGLRRGLAGSVDDCDAAVIGVRAEADRPTAVLPPRLVVAHRERFARSVVASAALKINQGPALVDRVVAVGAVQPALVASLVVEPEDQPLKLVVAVAVHVQVDVHVVAIDHVGEDLERQVRRVPPQQEPGVGVAGHRPVEAEDVVPVVGVVVARRVVVVRRGAVVIVGGRGIVVVRGDGVVVVADVPPAVVQRRDDALVPVVGVDAIRGEPTHEPAFPDLAAAVIDIQDLVLPDVHGPPVGVGADERPEAVAIGVEEAAEAAFLFAGVVGGHDLAAREGGQGEEGHEGPGQVAHLDLPWGLAPPAFARPLGTVALSGRWWSLGTQRPSVSGFLCQNLSTSK